MGLRYTWYRIRLLIATKTGVHKKKFPTAPPVVTGISLSEWRKNKPSFFIKGKEDLAGLKVSDALEQRVEELKAGKLRFFSARVIDLGTDYDWVTNPDSGHQYNVNKHWTEIPDFTKEAGDIKYVWEKARFTFLYDLMRYDASTGEDQSAFVFKQIEDFIDSNPINCGPNYRCSQEISLRTLNWTYALHYFANSENLTESLFDKIQNTIYWQLDHVYKNINFSRIAVRNNHAITETMMLYLSRFLYPQFNETERWSRDGKRWFQEEVDYQIYKDGTFLQFSMNYHRVLIQLLTWGIRLAQWNKDTLSDTTISKTRKSLDFLSTCMNEITGYLPNYGNNDGALFFPLDDSDYRDYRSQLDDLRAVLDNQIVFNKETYRWYGIKQPEQVSFPYDSGVFRFRESGYYINRANNSLSFIRCGAYKDRPFQSDNLHLDLSVDDKNILWDTGSFKYNTTEENLSFFTGSQGHNTIGIGDQDQMKRSGRFIWNYWIKKAKATITATDTGFTFTGTYTGFKQLASGIKHSRSITAHTDRLEWDIKDTVSNTKGQPVSQFWQLNPATAHRVQIKAIDAQGEVIEPVIEEMSYSGYYGDKQPSIRYTFTAVSETIQTTIKIIPTE